MISSNQQNQVKQIRLRTRYSSIFRISGNHRRAPRFPTAFQSSNSCFSFNVLFGRGRRQNTANCWSDLNCRPIREFLNCIMYCGRNVRIDSPSRESSSRFEANFWSCLGFHLFVVACQTYLSIPSNIVWRISHGVSE